MKLYRSIISLVIFGLLAALLPQPTFAQESYPIEPMPQEIAATLDALRQEYTEEIAAETRSRAALEAVDVSSEQLINSGCWLYGSLDEEALPDNLFNHNFQITGGGAKNGNYFYRSGYDHARITVVGSRAPDDQPHYGQAWMRSNKTQMVVVTEIGPDGNPRNQHSFWIIGDGEWHLWQERIEEMTLTISTAEGASSIDVDMFQTLACDVNFSFLPGVSQDQVSCPTGKIGRRKYGSETNAQIEQDHLLPPGAVTNPPNQPNIACWDVLQTFAHNAVTGETLDFMGVDRMSVAAVRLVPYNAVTGQALPWWVSRVIAVSSKAAGIAVTHMVEIAPYALLVGVAIGVVAFGWQIYLIQQDARPLYEPVYLEYQGTKFMYQQLASHEMIADNHDFYLYRISSILGTNGWLDRFNRTSMMSIYQTNQNGEATDGFIIATQHIAEAMIDTSHSFATLILVQDIIAQHDIGNGPLSDVDATELADAVEEWLNDQTKPIPPVDPDDHGMCSQPIPLLKVSNDIDLFETHVWINKFEVSVEMKVALLSPNQYSITYSQPQENWVAGTESRVNFGGKRFSDGLLHSVKYVCARVGGYGYWAFGGIDDFERVLPYRPLTD